MDAKLQPHTRISRTEKDEFYIGRCCRMALNFTTTSVLTGERENAAFLAVRNVSSDGDFIIRARSMAQSACLRFRELQRKPLNINS